MCDVETKLSNMTKIDRLIYAIEALNRTLGAQARQGRDAYEMWERLAKVDRLKAELAEAEKALK